MQLKVVEAATLLGIAPATLRVQIAAGKVKVVRFGGMDARSKMLLISRSEMEEYRRNRLGKRGKHGVNKVHKAESVTTAA